MPWLEPSLSLRWGPYTKLDGDEQGQIVTATIAAKEAKIITTRMAVQKIAGIFSVENVDAALDALEKESQENADKALKQAQAMKSVAGPPDPEAPPVGKSKPPATKPTTKGKDEE